MKDQCVSVCADTLPADLVRLLAALEPPDVARLDRAVRGLSGLHAVLTGLFGPRPDRTPVDAAELNDLERHVMDLEAKVERQDELIDRMADEVAGLHRLAVGQAERIAAQAEMLGRHAERAAERVPDPGSGSDPTPRLEPTVTVIDDPEAGIAPVVEPAPEPEAAPEPVSSAPEPEPEPEPDPVPEPSANGHGGSEEKRIAIARALHAAGPLGPSQIAERTGLPIGTVHPVVRYSSFGWWEKSGPGLRDPYRITDAGRAALRDAGYLLPGTVGQMVAKGGPATSRAREQLRLVVETLAAATTPLTAEGIAREAGLPVAAVEKRLERHGPAAASIGQLRYFGRDGDLWSLTDAGRMFARGEVTA